MEMMLSYNAIERDLDGWNRLFKRADERLKLQRVISPPGSVCSFLELSL